MRRLGPAMVRWRGTEVGGGGHEGIVRLASGRIRVRDSTVTGGAFTVDMRTIEITDIPEHEPVPRRRLRNHLEHEEFFAVERFPTARFVITEVERGDHGVFTVSGNLAIRDSVHNVTFEADAPVLSTDDLWATARFSFDRHLWGVAYDGTISRITDDLVHDDIQLEITLVARSAADGATACPRRAWLVTPTTSAKLPSAVQASQAAATASAGVRSPSRRDGTGERSPTPSRGPRGRLHAGPLDFDSGRASRPSEPSTACTSRSSTGAPFSTMKATRTPSDGELGSMRTSFPTSAASRSGTSKATCGTACTSSGMGLSGSKRIHSMQNSLLS